MLSPSYDSSLIGETELFLVFAVSVNFRTLCCTQNPQKSEINTWAICAHTYVHKQTHNKKRQEEREEGRILEERGREKGVGGEWVKRERTGS